MKKKVFLYLSSGLALVLLSASTPSNNPASTETTSHIDDWLIVGSPASVFTPGDGSLSVGNGARATGSSSLAVANGIDYGGGYIGGHATASGDSSFALGNYASASGHTSIAIGEYSHATGHTSFARGHRAIADGDESTADGSLSRASGFGSRALGSYCSVSGNFSFASGEDLQVNGTHTHIVGVANDAGSSSRTDNSRIVHSDNHLFVIGNGEAYRSRSNALVTKHSGETNLINKHWDSSSPLTESADDGHGNTGQALIVDGHTRLNGKVIIGQAQGDISMGIFGQ